MIIHYLPVRVHRNIIGCEDFIDKKCGTSLFTGPYTNISAIKIFFRMFLASKNSLIVVDGFIRLIIDYWVEIASLRSQ